MTYRQLQILCKKKGLPANGTKDVLWARLREAGIKKLRSFVFTGDPNTDHNPGWIYILGHRFKLNGKPVEVTDEAAGRLNTHTHFKEV